MIAQRIWSRLHTIASCSDGVFCSGTITNNQPERATLNRIIEKNKSMFKLIAKDRTAIYRLTTIYYSRYKLPYPPLLFRPLNEQEVLSRCIWSAFLIENNLKKAISYQPFFHQNHQLILDDFEDPDTNRVNSVLTCDDRYSFFTGKEVDCTIPSACMKRWVRPLLAKVFSEVVVNKKKNKDLIATVKDKEIKIPMERCVENAIWPKSNHDCHEDKRDYKDLGKLTGLQKWEMDISILPLWAKKNKSFERIKFGIYPR